MTPPSEVMRCRDIAWQAKAKYPSIMENPHRSASNSIDPPVPGSDTSSPPPDEPSCSGIRSESPAVDVAEASLATIEQPEIAPVPPPPIDMAWWRNIPASELGLLFDSRFYLDQLDATERVPADALAHYAEHGVGRLLSPNRLFDPLFYLDQPGAAVGRHDPFGHYLREGWQQGLNPHESFAAAATFDEAGQRESVVKAPILAVLQRRRLRPVERRARLARRGSAAADEAAFADWLRACGRVTLLTPLRHAISRLIAQDPSYAKAREALETAFDLRFYSSQLRQAGEVIFRLDLLLHYVDTGRHLGFKPHPFFHPLHYLDSNPDVTALGLEPLHHYLVYGWSESNRSFHPSYRLPSFDEYTTPAPAPIHQIAAYLAAPADERPVLSSTFAADFYRRMHQDVDWASTDPLVHYLSVGALRGDLPNPAFDSDYYAKASMTEGDRTRMSTLEHFDGMPLPRPKTFALFDAKYYPAHHSDLDFSGFDPVTHYLEWGVWEGRLCTAVKSTRYIYATFPERSFADRPPLGEYLARKANHRRRFIFIGHEATRTGAPGILLKLIQHFDSYAGIECISILDQDGPLLAEHAKVSHTFVMRNNRLKVYRGEIAKEEMFAELDDLMVQFDDNIPLGVFCNCAETRLYAEYFHRLDMPVVFLMHEIADLYPIAELQMVTSSSDYLIFPAQFVADAFHRALPTDELHHRVLPQGLLRDSFGDLARGNRAALFREWKLPIPEEAFIVLGCGTVDGRKGFDHFVATARKVRDASFARPVRFLWVGGRRDWRINEGAQWDTTGYWSSWDLKQHGLEQTLLVVPEVSDPEPFFVEADVFLLTSRLDPFPCVVHEAMASRLPVIGFSGTGGAPEAFLPDCGIAVNYPDTSAMADAILTLASDEPGRRRMGEAGRRRVKSDYRFDAYAERIKAVMTDAGQLAGPEPAPHEDGARERRPKIYFTSPTWSLSGVNTFTEALVEYLNAHGMEAEILITRGRFGPVRLSDSFYDPVAEVFPDVPYRMMQPADLSDAARQSAVRDFLRANAPCVLVPNYDYVVSDLARELPPTVGIVGIVHSDDAEHYDHCYRLGRFWDRIVAVSDEIATKTRALNPAFSPKLETIRYGLPPPPMALVQEAVARRVADAAPIRMVFAGRFEVFQKRIHDYAALAFYLAAERIPFHLDLIGEGAELGPVRAKLDGLVRIGAVSIPGRLSHHETLARMRQAHVVLILSDFEGLPLCLIEGLQNGCIPIAYAMRSGVAEIIADGVNGFVTPLGDLGAVVDRVRQLQGDRELRTRLIEAGLATVERARLTDHGMGQLYAALLQSVVANNASGAGRKPAVS